MFANLEVYSLKVLCQMCDIQIYQDKDIVKLEHGGVILLGSITSE